MIILPIRLISLELSRTQALRLSMVSLFGFVFVFSTPFSISSEVLKAKLANNDNRFHEAHEPEVDVSGNVVVGVMFATACTALSEDLLGIQSAKTGDGKICLKVTSRDGVYMSKNEYSVNVLSPAIINLPYQSSMKEIITSYAEDQGAIAVSATIGDCDLSSSAEFYLPAKINTDNATLKTDKLSIYINGFDATDVYYQFSESTRGKIFDCNYIKEDRHTAYNFSCDVPVEQLAGDGPWEIEILREVYGRELEPVTVRMLSTF